MPFPKVEHASDYYADKSATGWVVHDDWGLIVGHYTTRHDALNAALRKAEMLYNALTHALESYEESINKATVGQYDEPNNNPQSGQA